LSAEGAVKAVAKMDSIRKVALLLRLKVGLLFGKR